MGLFHIFLRPGGISNIAICRDQSNAVACLHPAGSLRCSWKQNHLSFTVLTATLTFLNWFWSPAKGHFLPCEIHQVPIAVSANRQIQTPLHIWNCSGRCSSEWSSGNSRAVLFLLEDSPASPRTTGALLLSSRIIALPFLCMVDPIITESPGQQRHRCLETPTLSRESAFWFIILFN